MGRGGGKPSNRNPLSKKKKENGQAYVWPSNRNLHRKKEKKLNKIVISWGVSQDAGFCGSKNWRIPIEGG